MRYFGVVMGINVVAVENFAPTMTAITTPEAPGTPSVLSVILLVVTSETLSVG